MKFQNKIKNDWYIDDQKKQQLNNIAYLSVIEQRWDNFYILLTKFMNEYDTNAKFYNILDAGSGDGNNVDFLLKFFARRNLKIRLTALDYNEVRVKRLNRIKNIQVEYGDLLDIKHPKEKFDFILCSHVIEHIENCNLALKELKRVLKKNGFLILSIPNEGCFLSQIRNNIFQRTILKHTDHKHFFTKKTFLTLAQKSGFKLANQVLLEGFSFPHSGVDRRLRKFSFWRKTMVFCSKIFPSQSGSLTFLFKKGS